jgi:hypothetical protein
VEQQRQFSACCDSWYSRFRHGIHRLGCPWQVRSSQHWRESDCLKPAHQSCLLWERDIDSIGNSALWHHHFLLQTWQAGSARKVYTSQKLIHWDRCDYPSERNIDTQGRLPRPCFINRKEVFQPDHELIEGLARTNPDQHRRHASRRPTQVQAAVPMRHRRRTSSSDDIVWIPDAENRIELRLPTDS